jgi:hypothetical protein
MELEQTSFVGGKAGAFVEVRGAEECGALRGKKSVGYGHRSQKSRGIGELAVRAHSCGPEVERGRCPNLGCFWDFGCSAIVEVELILSRSCWAREK